MVRKYIKTLEEFNSKVHELKSSNFARWHEKNALKLIINLNGKRSEKGSSPSRESVKAFVLTFRFFIQDNEKISLRNLNNIFKQIRVSKVLKEVFSYYRNEINSYLDGPTSIKIKGKERFKNLTKRKVLNTVIYGHLAHENNKKKIYFESLTKDDFYSRFIWFEFFSTLRVIYLYLISISENNKSVIGELNKLIKKPPLKNIK